MIDPVTMNARKPQNDQFGNAMLERMNEHHRGLYKWGLEHVSLESSTNILDIGFGGGQNIKTLHSVLPQARIYGIDYAQASYDKCRELNLDAIQKGLIELKIGSAESLPYQADFFNLVTAFETVYYWPNIVGCFQNVFQVLQKNGTFLICNEDSSLEGNEEIAAALNMNIYTSAELEGFLHQAGFKKVFTYSHENSRWVCAVAVK